jgi:hypothetical protein
MIDIKRLRELEVKATKGDWCACTNEDHCSAITSNGAVTSFAATLGTVHANARTRADAEFIAEARNALPELLAMLEEARWLVEEQSADEPGYIGENAEINLREFEDRRAAWLKRYEGECGE